MRSACHSVRPGGFVVQLLGGRAVLLSSVVWLSWCGMPPSASAVEGEEITRPTPAAAAEPVDDLEKIPADDRIAEPTFRRIGPVTTITEVSSGLPFPARVDTGATTCSIHYEEIEIEDAAEDPEDNVGKRVRMLIQNPNGEKEWINTKIADHVTVRTTTDDEQRYKVPLNLRWQDVEKKVMVTLKDRGKMKYPLLLGRNFLKGDFLVDVNLDGE